MRDRRASEGDKPKTETNQFQTKTSEEKIQFNHQNTTEFELRLKKFNPNISHPKKRNSMSQSSIEEKPQETTTLTEIENKSENTNIKPPRRASMSSNGSARRRRSTLISDGAPDEDMINEINEQVKVLEQQEAQQKSGNSTGINMNNKNSMTIRRGSLVVPQFVNNQNIQNNNMDNNNNNESNNNSSCCVIL